VEGSGQTHTPAVLYPGKVPEIPILLYGVWAPGAVWTFWGRENSFRPAGSEPGSSCLLSSHSTDCLIQTHVFCKVKKIIYIFKLIGNIKPLIFTANLLHEI
jgi:hypothetical protein